MDTGSLSWVMECPGIRFVNGCKTVNSFKTITLYILNGELDSNLIISQKSMFLHHNKANDSGCSHNLCCGHL